MSYRIPPILCALALSACAPAADLDAAKNQVQELTAQVSALQAENTRLKDQLAKKPALPVKASFRRALLGPGYVAVFDTTVKSPVQILVTVASAALGTTKRFELHLNPDRATELGHLEGAVIENGDLITMENTNYSPMAIQVRAE